MSSAVVRALPSEVDIFLNLRGETVTSVIRGNIHCQGNTGSLQLSREREGKTRLTECQAIRTSPGSEINL